ncbi:MAG: vitamin B12-dependent ribonucleotide reductase [Candidatus Marsarchaeota archaeon]
MGGQIQLTDTAIKILEARYLIKDENGNLKETPEGMFRRVAESVASAEKLYGATDEDVRRLADEFFAMMASLDFIPNSPTLMNAGTPLGQLSACFVLPVPDSIEGIFDSLKYTAIIHKSGGGTGFSFSRIRPKNDIVKSTMGVASGPVSFMKIFDAATEQIKQGGRRRGANMGILRVDHPDIEEFISCKADMKTLQNFNISVGATEEYMRALKSDSTYKLVNPRNGRVVAEVSAKKIFDEICKQAWSTGDPGMVFLDRINEFNPTPQLGEIESTNPCGEQPLLPYESCNLGSINLGHFVIGYPDSPRVDWDRLSSVVRKAIRFLDDVIDANAFPLKEIDEMTKKTRKIGLGVMGWADMLIKLGVPYDSEEGLFVASSIAEFINYESKLASIELAKERGPFPAFKGSVYDGDNPKLPFSGRVFGKPLELGRPKLDWEAVKLGIKQNGIRNADTITIAPTGTISMIGGASSGIEPLFAVAFVKKVSVGEFPEVNPLFEDFAKRLGFYSKELMERISKVGRVGDDAEVPAQVKRLFKTALEIDVHYHVAMQAAWQAFVDNAVSKTINMRNSATVDDVATAYLEAYELGCKGITIYRDGSRSEQVLYSGTSASTAQSPPTGTAAQEKKEQAVVVGILPEARPAVLTGMTIRMKTDSGNLYVTINEKDGRMFEVFTTLGKSGAATAAFTEAIGRLISLALRIGADPSAIVKELVGIRGGEPVWQEGERVLSVPDAIGKAINRYLEMKAGKTQGEQKPLFPVSSKPEGEKPKSIETRGEDTGNEKIIDEEKDSWGYGNPTCPECGSPLIVSEGCMTCPVCGWSKCDRSTGCLYEWGFKGA